MIKVLHVIDSLQIGGTEHQLVQMVQHSDSSTFQHVICLLRKQGRWFQELPKAGIEIHALGLGSNLEFLWGINRLRRLMRHIQPDIVHTFLFRSTIIGRVVGRLTNRPVVTTFVNMPYEFEWRVDDPALKRWKTSVVHAIDAKTASWTARYIAVSSAVKASAVRHLGVKPDNITVIPRGLVWNGGPPVAAQAAAAIRRSLGWSASDFLILNVGRQVPQKGQQYLIDAMPQVLKTLPQARLAIAGDGRLQPQHEAQIRRCGLEQHVKLLGGRDDIPALLAAADLFAFPSLSEGFGLALLEAMASSRPCIASDIPSIRELVGEDGATLVPPRSVKALAQAIVQLARDEDRRRALAVAAAQRARTFDAAISVRRVEAVYRSLVTENLSLTSDRT